MEYSHGYGAMFEICELYGCSKASEAAVRILITLMNKVELRPCDRWQPTNARHPSTGRPWRHHGPWTISMEQRPCLMPHASCLMPPHDHLQHDMMSCCNGTDREPGFFGQWLRTTAAGEAGSRAAWTVRLGINSRSGRWLRLPGP